MAAANNSNPRRISVVGATGSGKSYLARQLAEHWHLPLFELDRVYWGSERKEPALQQFIDDVYDLSHQEKWVLDGHYRAVREMIWARADMIIWLNYSLWLVGFRLLQRYARKGRQRDHRRSEPHSINQKGDHDLHRATWSDRLGRIARTLRERREYALLLNAPEFQHAEIVELTSVRATQEWLRECGARTR